MKVTLPIANRFGAGTARPRVPLHWNRSINKDEPSLSAAAQARRCPPGQGGMALVITLILLSVITFMAIAFLVLSRTQRSSTGVATQQSVARLAADAALARAQADVIARIMANKNEFDYRLMVSRNYINRDGFDPNLPPNNPTNVNYDYLVGGGSLNPVQFQQNVANLLFDPRPPVFIPNRFTGASDFRFYLDLNRNGRFEDSGLLPEINPLGGYYDLAGNMIPSIVPLNTLSNFFAGDPQWIGGLEFPGRLHSADNQFVYRYSYYVVPSGETLDVNYIHNQAKQLGPTAEGFLRNQGAGSYEINLASFLMDLNTNLWPFAPQAGLQDNIYNPDPGNSSRGDAFEDALAILRYRYAWDYTRNLSSVSALFGPQGTAAFLNDGIDGYSAANPLNVSLHLPVDPDTYANRTSLPWPGADNTNHFFTSSQDLFDPLKVSYPFYNRLMAAGTNSNSSYDRYTYYRLLSQLGTDSAPDTDKINLNYQNVDAQGNIVPGMASSFSPWSAEQFFTTTANRLLKDAGFNFTTTNIQVYPTNYYTPSVHRLLQLAANIYDATANRTLGIAPNGFPTVLRPFFAVSNSASGPLVFIVGYRELTDATTAVNPPPVRDLWGDTNAVRSLQPFELVSGVPFIIGARKGFPNFNEFAMNMAVTVSRKLEFWRNTANLKSLPYTTNQMIIVGISNSLGAEFWNSYTNFYPRPLTVRLQGDVRVRLTNELGMSVGPIGSPGGWTTPFLFSTITNIATWPGSLTSGSFCVPVNLNGWHMTNSVWQTLPTEQFVPIPGGFQAPGFRSPRWWLVVHTRLQCSIVDTSVSPNRIVDYVTLDAPETPVDIAAALMSGGTCDGTQDGRPGSMWCTNRPPGVGPLGPTYGILNQIAASRGVAVNSSWGQIKNIGYQVDFFRYNFNGENPLYGSKNLTQTNHFFAPYPASRTIYFATAWQANDPLVHYTIGDLTGELANRVTLDNPPGNTGQVGDLGGENDRYRPWGEFSKLRRKSSTATARYLKDPLVTRSDNWDFPTNKFANIGWLGRVHRGTPWQTLYLKSEPADLATWKQWSGNSQFFVNDGRLARSRAALNAVVDDAVLTSPTNDWSVLDLFTTAFNDNASRGKLSVNQSGLAAWSAVLGDVIVLTNPFPAPEVGLPIAPAGIYNPLNSNALPPLARMVNAINRTRAAQPTKAFPKLGDILAVPELTVSSPFLNTAGTLPDYGISEAAYERIPQQILGLLKCDHTPRFVIYSYGQALKPANKGIVTGGTFFGLCTNYQVTAEVATRTVIRVEGGTQHPRAVVESFNLLGPE